MYLRYFDGSTESVLSPLNKAHILIYISFIWDGFSFDLGSAFTLFHLSVLPRLVISFNHMESLFCLLHNRLIQCHFLLPWSSRVVLLFKGSLAWVGHSAVSLDSLFSRPSRSCQYHVLSHQMFWSSARAGLRRSPLTSCRRVCLLSTTTHCSESKPRAAPWAYFHHW